MPKILKVGPITMALGLIIFGTIMLLNNFVHNSYLLEAWKLWPLLLVGLGVEFLIRDALRKKSSDAVELRFSWISVLLIGFIAFAGFTSSVAYKIAGSTELDQIIKENIFGNAINYTRTFEEAPIEIKETGTKLILDNTNGTVVVKPSSDNKIYVTGEIIAYASSKEEAKQRAEEVTIDLQVNKDINIKSIMPNKYGSIGINLGESSRVNYEILVPKGMILALNNDVGGVDVKDIEGQVIINSNVGRVNATNLVGDVTIENGTGDINVEKVIGKLNLDTNTGRIEIDNPGSDVLASTSTGRIKLLSADPLKGKYDISTKTGRIDITIPEESDLIVEAFTGTGSIDAPEALTVDRDGPRQSAEGKIGSGAGILNLKSQTGRISLMTN